MQTKLEYLISHLVQLEEHRLDLLDTYFPVVSRRRTRKDMELWIDRYIAQVEALISDRNERAGRELPIVLIGCTVDVEFQYFDTPQMECYTICFPHEADPSKGYISFLSSIGKQLLLASAHSKVVLYTPNGEMDAMIRRITIPSAPAVKYWA